MAGHVAPEAAHRGPIAALQDGDTITFDIQNRTLGVDLSPEELESRLAGWREPEPRFSTGVMAKYAALVSSASEGAVTDPNFGLTEYNP
jgi:dihydroxy-acid dehydratase